MVLFVSFVALHPKSTAMVMAGWSVHLTTLFPEQASTFYPPTRKGSGDIAISLASVRLSVCPSVRLSVRLSVRRQKLVRSITFIPFEIF